MVVEIFWILINAVSTRQQLTHNLSDIMVMLDSYVKVIQCYYIKELHDTIPFAFPFRSELNNSLTVHTQMS